MKDLSGRFQFKENRGLRIMPRFRTDLYVDDIYVKTYFTDADDESEAFEMAKEEMRAEILLDVEEIDE